MKHRAHRASDRAKQSAVRHDYYDFVKMLCVPFAYNLPRYKNLSIDGLFDRNHIHYNQESMLIDEDLSQE